VTLTHEEGDGVPGTTDRHVLEATLGRTLDIESPGPSTYFSTRATTLDALEAAPTLNYFPPAMKKRVLVVLTDGETLPLERDLASAFAREPKIQTVFVHIWEPDERIYLTGVAEFGYAADARSEAELARIASLVGGRVVSEGDSEGLAAGADGSRRERPDRRSQARRQPARADAVDHPRRVRPARLRAAPEEPLTSG
jgi:hypothetical protein